MAAGTADRFTIQDALNKLNSIPERSLPLPTYSKLGDFLSLYFSDIPAYSERVDETLTIYRSMSDGEVVGCKIKGVSLLAQNVANIFRMQDGEVEIRLLLLNAAGPQKARHFYYDLGGKCEGIKVPLREILPKAA